jgi:hypothetical protein
MNCQTYRQWLASPDDERETWPRAELDEHLSACAACRAYGAEAQSMLRLLNELPDPEVRIDVRAVLAGSAARTQDRARRRWRAAAALATAACLLLAAWGATRVQIEWRPGAMTVAWGRGAHGPTRAAATPLPSDGELARLNEIAGLLAAELEDQDARHRRDLALLLGQIRQLQSAQRADIALLERDFRALYAATQTSYTPTTGDQP